MGLVFALFATRGTGVPVRLAVRLTGTLTEWLLNNTERFLGSFSSKGDVAAEWELCEDEGWAEVEE